MKSNVDDNRVSGDGGGNSDKNNTYTDTDIADAVQSNFISTSLM